MTLLAGLAKKLDILSSVLDQNFWPDTWAKKPDSPVKHWIPGKSGTGHCQMWRRLSHDMLSLAVSLITGCAVAPAVLTTTGFVNGKGQFSTPYRIDTPPTICHRWLRRQPLRLCQIRCISVHGGLLSTWVKYNQNYFYFCPFLGTHLQVRPVDGFSRMMAQTMRTRARICLLGIFYIASHLLRQKLNFGAWIGVFKPNSQNRKTYILSKILHRFQPNFAQW